MEKNRLFVARSHAKMSQSALAQAIGVSRITIIRWEKQDLSNGAIDVKQSDLIKLATALGVTTDYLMGRSDSPSEALPESPAPSSPDKKTPPRSEERGGFSAIYRTAAGL